MSTFRDLKCEVCGVSGSVVAMHRANPKGEKGRWRCESCLDSPPDPKVLAVTDYFSLDSRDAVTDQTVSPELDCCYYAWTIIANAHGGNWDEATPEWREAAERWRDQFHKLLDANPVGVDEGDET